MIESINTLSKYNTVKIEWRKLSDEKRLSGTVNAKLRVEFVSSVFLGLG